jgi:hypothetical protein
MDRPCNYLDDGGWEGSTLLEGGSLARFDSCRIPSAGDGRRHNRAVADAGAGLTFGMDWSDGLLPPDFHEIAEWTATTNWMEWTDEGDIDRPHPAFSHNRFYRLRARP